MSIVVAVTAALLILGILAGIGFGLFLLIRKLVAMPENNHANSSESPSGSSSDIPSSGRPASAWLHSMTGRSLMVGLIGLLMLIPVGLVSDLVRERQYLYDSVLEDIAASWGQRQDLRGPALVVPYQLETVKVERITGDDGKVRTVRTPRLITRTAVTLPSDLQIKVEINGEYRHRGIYESLVYTADLGISGKFERPEIGSLSENIKRIHWDKARLLIGISDTRAIVEAEPLAWAAESVSWAPGAQLPGLLDSGFHAPLDLSADTEEYLFSAQLRLNGSDGFYFAPFGETTEVAMNSGWPHPSFQGAILPSEYSVHEAGFDAQWSIPHLARNYPQLWTAETSDVSHGDLYTTGVRLFQPVFLYSLVERAVKYGLLFIALTFLTFIIFELTLARRLHFVQYGLVGMALALFYLILLSLAEHIAFGMAYLAASATAIGMIGLYTAAALSSLKRSMLVVVMLAGLYTLLYSILHLEDYALLMGTGLLVLVVAVLMYVTRNLQQTESS